MNEAIEYALSGEALLFLGSGFSLGCKNIIGEGFPIGTILADKLYAELNETSDGDLITASEMFVEEKGQTKLVELLRNLFTVKELSQNHLDIAKVKWKNIYTTNYDDVLERIFVENDIKKVPVTCENNVFEYAKNKEIVVHINGYIDFLSEKSLQSAFKLTDTSYLTQAFSDSQWSYAFRKDLKLAKTVIFIGYSMYDLDIRKILTESPDLRSKTFFITEKNPSKKTMFKLQRFGEILPIELSGLIFNINEKMESWHEVSLPVIYYSLKKYPLRNGIHRLSDKDLFSLHLYGKIKSELMDKEHENKYLFKRECTTRIIKALDKGKVALIHASLGNGKTVIVHQISNHYAEKGYFVYEVGGIESDWESEIYDLAQKSEPVLLVIENYHRYLDVIKYFILHKKINHKLLLSERSDINDIKIDSLDLMENELVEFDINKIDYKSKNKIIENFNEYGLWGGSASLSFRKKADRLDNEYKSEFSNILLDVFDSPLIKDKVTKLTDEIKSNKDHRDIIIFAAITSILGYNISHYDAADYLDSEAIFGASIRSGSEFKQLLGEDDSYISIRSSVLAKHILSSMGNPSHTIDVLVKVIRKAHELSSHNTIASYLAKDLVRFGNIQTVIPQGVNRSACITRYYEQIKNLSRNSRNPHFWLQYAISQLTMGDMDSAEIYFETAYSYAKQAPWYETEPLDNHYARFLLEKATEETDIAKAFPIFEQSHFSLRKQKRRHYPYKVANGYTTFYYKHKYFFSEQQLQSFASYCNDVLNNIESLDDRTKNHRNVKECKGTLNKVLIDISENTVNK